MTTAVFRVTPLLRAAAYRRSAALLEGRVAAPAADHDASSEANGVDDLDRHRPDRGVGTEDVPSIDMTAS
jgi:hypothetical protein